MRLSLRSRLKEETVEAKRVKDNAKALIFAACYDSIIPVAERAKALGVGLPDIYMGTCVGALLCLFIPLQEYALLDAALRDYRAYYAQEPELRTLVRKWVFSDAYNLTTLLERHYTPMLHSELQTSPALVIVGLANISTAKVEYFDLSALTYREAIKVVLASIQQPYLTPVEIKGNYYLEANLLDHNHSLHVMDLGANELDVLVARHRHPQPSAPWKPTSSLSGLERLFGSIRSYKPEFQDYSVHTIAQARQIKVQIHYLDDPVEFR